MGESNHASLGCEGFFQILQPEGTVLVWLQARDSDFSSQFHGSDWAADGIVFQAGGDDMVALFQRAFQRDVEGIGAVESENPAIRIFAGEELVEQVAGVVERAFGFHGHAVPGAAGVGHGITGEPVHGDIDRFGLWVRG